MTELKVNTTARQNTIETMAADANREKSTHKIAKYRPQSEDANHCDNCRYFVGDRESVAAGTKCSLVRDPIHREGKCDWWTPMGDGKPRFGMLY